MDVRKVTIGLALWLLLENSVAIAAGYGFNGHGYPEDFAKDIFADIDIKASSLFDDLDPFSGKPYHSDFLLPAGPYPSDPLLEWKPLAEQGDVTAQYNLGVIYENGVGTQRNYRTAGNWYTKAIEQGFPYAQYNLGNMYANGKGFLENDKIALEWWTKAAEQGDAKFQYKLAQIYSSGKDVKKSYKAYVKWTTLAAKQGYGRAQMSLAYEYRSGRINDSLVGTLFGFNVDDVKAYMWMNLGIYNGTSLSKAEKEAFINGMTKAQIAKAQDMSNRCLESNYTDC
jgi:TPR repeat protein|tara:strand:+ start:345 stop:1193 length:849 start_codon:yes stop_codon:yes gene_type:complete